MDFSFVRDVDLRAKSFGDQGHSFCPSFEIQRSDESARRSAPDKDASNERLAETDRVIRLD